jgi:carbon-monoxide dehydrogenase iron sulfur subunit
MALRKGMIVVDPARCLACRSCELACAVAHSRAKTLMGAICESPAPESRVSLEVAEDLTLPLQCRHCEDAPCVAVCPTHALSKSEAEGPVLLNQEACIGCKSCVLVCPFGVIHLSRDGKAMIKCDLCIERLEAGRQPACVSACPTGALRFESTAETAEATRRRAAREFLVTFKSQRQPESE